MVVLAVTLSKVTAGGKERKSLPTSEEDLLIKVVDIIPTTVHWFGFYLHSRFNQ